MNEVKVEGVEMGITMVGKGSLTIEKGTTINFMGNEGVGVIVGGEVTAELTGTKIVGGGNEKSTGVYAMGVGEMTMTLEGVMVSGVGKGVSVEGKGSLTIRDGSVDFTGAHGVYVGSEVKSASLTGTKIVGGGSGVGVNILGGTVTWRGWGFQRLKRG